MQSAIKRGLANEDPEVLLSYRGKVTEELFDTLLELAEHKLDQEKTTSKVKRKVFKVLVESLQNVYHHFDELPPKGDAFPVSFSLEKDNFNYRIHTGNHVMLNKVSTIKQFIDSINKMSDQQLRGYYRARLSDGNFSANGGAGLGIVDIIRKSGEKITYNFQPVNEDYSYFSLQVKISA